MNVRVGLKVMVDVGTTDLCHDTSPLTRVLSIDHLSTLRMLEPAVHVPGGPFQPPPEHVLERPFGESPVRYREGPLEYEPAVLCQCGVKMGRFVSWQNFLGRRFYKCVWWDKDPAVIRIRIVLQGTSLTGSVGLPLSLGIVHLLCMECDEEEALNFQLNIFGLLGFFHHIIVLLKFKALTRTFRNTNNMCHHILRDGGRTNIPEAMCSVYT
uniref:Uncharacterized protein n=1 Tax=Oryza nivara TaxID=4536 RepID=A0A0E0HKT3_ORYNI